jgi:serine/threonine-protein kinase
MTQDGPTPIAGRYAPGRRLGGGGTTEVVTARDTHLDRTVALKVLRPEARADAATLERLRRAAQETGALRGHGIVDVYDWEADAASAYLAMEFVDGGTLGDTLRSHGPVSPERALALATATAGALEGIHRAGSVHGGVTPDAVLISREGWSKLTTLRGGQAPATDPEDARHLAGYCSPEVLRGGPVDASADVWALGVTLYESLTGARPFEGADAAAVAASVQRDIPVAPSQRVVGVPFVLDGVVMRLLSRDPANRIADAATARAELSKAAAGIAAPPTVANPAAAGAAVAATQAMPPVSGGGSGAAPVATVVDDGPGARPNRWLVPTVIGLVVVVAALVVFALLSGGGGGSNGGDKVTVPAVVGLRRQEALTRLDNAGLSAVEVTEPNEDFGKDIVFAQSPTAGKQINPDRPVTIKVSSGPTPTTSSSTTSSSTTSSTTTSSSTTTTSSTTTSTTTTTIPPTTTT